MGQPLPLSSSCTLRQHLSGSPELYAIGTFLGAKPYWSFNPKPLLLLPESPRAKGEHEGLGWVRDIKWNSTGEDSGREKLDGTDGVLVKQGF